MGGGKTTQTTVENRDPWHGQQPHLLRIFGDAQQLYDQQRAENDPGYTGDMLAPPRQEQVDAFTNALDFANNQGSEWARLSGMTGGQAIGQGMLGSGAAMGGLFGMANMDPSAANLATAAQYADNPFIGQMTDAAMRDARRTHDEVTSQQIDRNAAATGNLNSSRTAIAQGIAERGLAERAADISATMRGQAWSQGLGMAQADQDRRLAAMQGLGALGQGMTQTGLGGLGQALGMMRENVDMSTMASSMLTAMDQQKIDNELAKIEYSQMKDWEPLAKYYGLVGDKSWGYQGQSTTTTRNQPSALQTIGTAATIFGSLFKCDRSTKENIIKIGVLDNGINIYSFSYIDDPEHRLVIGPMADEVEEIMPEAVVVIDGIKHVDMGRVIEEIK